MRIRSVHYIAFIMLLVYCLIGCNSTVFDDLGGCPQGVYFQFYRQTLANNFLISVRYQRSPGICL